MAVSTRRQTQAELNADAKLLVSPGPHIHAPLKTHTAMYAVIAALLPVSGVSVYLFGRPALYTMLVATIAAVIAESIFLWMRRKPQSIANGSAALTGLLLALTLPPDLPLWMTALGSVVAIGLGKHAFGGLGANPFNPALVGRAFLTISFAAPLTTFRMPFDGVTGATPLNTINVEGSYPDLWALFAGTTGGSLGETSVIALLIGAALLLALQIIDWRIPAGMIGSVAIIALLAGHDPLAHILSGGLILGAFFMATDWVTSPITRKGKWIFAIGIGVITMVIRLWAQAPEGVSYAILVMNGASPLINALTRPKGRLKG